MTERIFGDTTDAEIGDRFVGRRGAFTAGVHRHTQAGICGSQNDGAESVVVNGGYEDDEDLGDVIIYTGHGGNDPATARQIADQKLERGNKALAVNKVEGIPVRVLRGSKTEYGPTSGFRYDGLFYVEDFWQDTGKSGFKIWRYRLVKEPTAPVSPAKAVTGVLLPVGESEPKRVEVTTQRISRNTAVGTTVKTVHGYRCQICGVVLDTPAGRYAEAAHIRPLGKPHNGPDTPDNVLCLCPNHHVLLDTGALFIRNDLTVINAVTSHEIGVLATRPGHAVSPTSLAYHRTHWAAE